MAQQPLTRDDAMDRFRRLVSRYGLRWTADVPRSAHEELAEIDKVLDADDRREAIGLPRSSQGMRP